MESDPQPISTKSPRKLFDFAFLVGVASLPSMPFVVSERALGVLDQPGLAVLRTFKTFDGSTRFVVQVLLQLDLLDHDLSLRSDWSAAHPESVQVYTWFNLIDEADSIAGRSVFCLPPPNSRQLFCSTSWKDSYEQAELTGLRFEIAKVAH